MQLAMQMEKKGEGRKCLHVELQQALSLDPIMLTVLTGLFKNEFSSVLTHTHTHTHTTVISLFIRAATAMGSTHRFSFLMQHCKNHKFAHQLTCYCPAWTVDLDLNSVSKCVCFRGSVININLSAEVSKALYQKLILLSAKALTRNTRPKCSPHIPSSSSQTHTGTTSMQQEPSNTHSFSFSHHWRINTAENDFALKSSNCPGSLALKQITDIKEKHPWNKNCCYWTSARHVLLWVEKTSSLTKVFHLGKEDNPCCYY